MQSSLESTGKSRERAQGWLADQAVLNAAALVPLLILCLPVFTTGRAPINSDQSLYLSEALNIANGDGLTYTNGEPITHRAPVQPALIAGAFALNGMSLDSAYLVPRLSITANVLLLFFLGRLLFGGWGGLIAAVAAASSLYLRGLGTSLYLDSTQATFLLAALLVYSQAGASAFRVAGAGALLGVSFLVKEASVLFLPLPVVVSLLYGFDAGWKRAVPAWVAGFGAATAWWFAWVYAHTGDVYLAGQFGGALGLIIPGAVVATLAGGFVVLKYAPARFEATGWTRAGAGVVVVLWCALFLNSLESSAWQFESNYVANVSAYLVDIFASNVQPAMLVAASWVWLFWTALRSREAGLLVVGTLLYASFFIVVADRGLSLRDQLPVVYFSYLALGGAAAWLVKAGASFDLGPRVRALGGGGAVAVIVASAATILLSGTGATHPSVNTLQDDWENSLSRQAAAWLEQNLAPGARISSSRLYHSQLYLMTGGAFPTYQLPTVEVELDMSPDGLPLSRRSTLFRWGDFDVPADSPSDAWLYLTRYPHKGYFIAMAENDLLAHLEGRQIDYVVLSTLDAGFSSPSFRGYFEDNPAFELLHVISATSLDEVRVYRVDRSRLAPRGMPAQVTAPAYEYIVARLSSVTAAADYLGRVNPAGFRLTER